MHSEGFPPGIVSLSALCRSEGQQRCTSFTGNNSALLPTPSFSFPSTCLPFSPLCGGMSILHLPRVWKTRLCLGCNSICSPKACLSLSGPLSLHPYNSHSCDPAALPSVARRLQQVYVFTGPSTPYPNTTPSGGEWPIGRWEVPALYLRILARFPAAMPPAPLVAAGSPSSSGSDSWLPRLCQEASALSVSRVCLPGMRVALGGSTSTGRGRSWGRKGPRPVPGAHQSSTSWPVHFWVPHTVLAVSTQYDPAWAHPHWLGKALVLSLKGQWPWLKDLSVLALSPAPASFHVTGDYSSRRTAALFHALLSHWGWGRGLCSWLCVCSYPMYVRSDSR